MAKFSKPFLGVKDGEIYPTEFVAGDDCPDELAGAAQIVGALSEEPAGAAHIDGALLEDQEAALPLDKENGTSETASVKKSK